ncbi:hypothetical protein E2562_001087 [Oryza meyeriana var. granulata]|uniref:Uncharacterized protein n=1 Tax=Oryza meyeriana var. granulata TaxID=110450 RepID=A0A6G1ED20_9ORYZ|nr:hypothetical protein E2562_001087 [Oryza meyeriana var. granulata]
MASSGMQGQRRRWRTGAEEAAVPAEAEQGGGAQMQGQEAALCRCGSGVQRQRLPEAVGEAARQRGEREQRRRESRVGRRPWRERRRLGRGGAQAVHDDKTTTGGFPIRGVKGGKEDGAPARA